MITLSKIAKLANVSISTASKAFSGSPGVNEQTRELVFNIAKEHGVFKKFYNAKYPRLVIAVIVPEFQSRHYGPLLYEIQKCLDERGCVMSVAGSNFIPEENERIFDYFTKYTNADGIIIIGHVDDIPSDTSLPCAVIGGAEPHPCASVVCNEITGAFRDAVSMLKERGAATVGFISEPKTVGKMNIFKKLMTEIYGSYDESYTVVTEGRFEEGGYEGMRDLITRGHVPRAIFCGYDDMAIGAMRCLTDNGLRVPDDVALIGFDNTMESKYVVPSLTTIDLAREKCARSAVDTVINKIMGKPAKSFIKVNSDLHLRESTAIK